VVVRTSVQLGAVAACLIAWSGSASAQPSGINSGDGHPAPPAASGNWTPLAVVGFDAVEQIDPRDAWLPTAVGETLAWRLRRTPGLTVIPTTRTEQSRQELLEKAGDPPAEWARALPLTGAKLWLRGTCSGTPHQTVLDLELRSLEKADAVPARTRLGPGRLFEVIDDATRWSLGQLGVARIAKDTKALIFAPPAKSPSALEYYAKALAAARREDLRDAAYYIREAVESDPGCCPAIMLLAKLELRSAAASRADAHLRQVKLVASLRQDVFTEVEFEITQGLALMMERSFEPARRRFETALGLARERNDPYGQLMAMNALCDYWLNCPPSAATAPAPDANEPRNAVNLRRAAEWETRVLELLDALGDRIAAAPAANKLALIYERLNDSECAIAAHRRTIAAAKEIGSTRTEATGYLFLGQWYRRQERWPEALETISRCLALAPQDAQPMIRLTLGEVYRGMSRPRDALAEYEAARAAIHDSDDLMGQFRCLHASAELRMELGETDEAIRQLAEALDIAHALELPEEPNIRSQLAQWKGQAP
jgi:tetratricopeptide (TPR) repeat protein